MPIENHVDHLTREFLAESLEGLERVDRCLTELEARPDNTEVLSEVFRCIHTIKGTTGFLCLGRMEKLAHAGEHLLGALRDGRARASETIVDGLLQLVDRMRSILRLIELTGGEGERVTDEDSTLIDVLISLTPAAKAASAMETLSIAFTDELPDTASASSGDPFASHFGLNDNTLRIEVEVLNRMMDLVGELVLTRNQILQSRIDSADFPLLARRLDSVTTDLRENVMQARLQPVGYLFSKFPRMVRDLARSCGKVVRLEFSGQETGLDKSLLEAIRDPIAHAIRNCIDHGIESPGQRLLAGKTAEGVLSLRAFHQSGSVIIDVFDDGAGIMVDKVLRTAVERGFVSAERAAAMSDRDVLQLVFALGFSTSEAVTLVSGRGVGMDVIRANIEKAGGSVELQSVPGSGTHLRMMVPLTLAIVPALVVQSGGQTFCMPQASLVELIYVPRREADHALEWLGGTQFYRLRDRLLPTIRLDDLMLIDPREQSRPEHGLYLAVLEAEGCHFGLAVDDLRAPEEIVVKPLSDGLREIGLFSGATVLGNGTLALILDIPACAARAGLRPAADGQYPAQEPAAFAVPQATEVQRSFLVFQNDRDAQSKERSAIPLEVVERIESIGVDEIELVDGAPVLQYRGGLLRLEDRHGILAELTLQSGRAQATVLVCQSPLSAANARERPPREFTRSGPTATTERIGVVVRQVLDVAPGRMLEEPVAPNGNCVAMIEGRMTTVPAQYATGGIRRLQPWPEVA